MTSPLEDKDITVFARTDFRGQHRTFGIRQADRRFHVYVVGKTGTGKSTLLENLILQDARRGQGLALLDPHGDLSEKIIKSMSEEQRAMTIYINASDPSQPFAFNPLERVSPDKFSLAASGLLGAFKSIWLDSWGPRLEHILRHAIMALLETHGSTLADIARLLADKAFRRVVATALKNTQIRNFWLGEYEHYTERLRAEAIAPLQNKVGAFLADPNLNRILTQPQSSIHLRTAMDQGNILIVNLAKGKMGQDASRLLGALLLSRLCLAAMSRADQPENERRDFIVYLDEFQNYATPELAVMLSELRKYRLSLVLAHQYLSQLGPELRDAVLGNVGTIIAFRMGIMDADLIAKEFYPDFTAGDLVNLPNYHIYLKLMIDGVVSNPFSAVTLPPVALSPKNDLTAPGPE